jgi:D-cysteine desulfhydrase family pyridoxal phosphate-dependent enzyme
MHIGDIPRVKLTDLPTPLEEMPRFAQALDGPRLLIKRDDQTGLCLGGNKARKLEFIMADAKNQGATVIITTGGPQTNHGRMTIAAAVKLGMKPVLVPMGAEPKKISGNLLVDLIMGAEIHYVPEVKDEGLSSYDRWRRGLEDVDNKMEEIAAGYRAKGEKPYIIQMGGTSVQGTIGYVNASVELLTQLNEQGIKADYIVTAVGTGGTYTGLLLGMKMLNSSLKVLGISVTAKAYLFEPLITYQASEAAELLGKDTIIEAEEIEIYDQYIGAGYGHPTKEAAEAIKRLARTEGIITDPVYTGKVVAGIIDLVNQGRFTKKETVIFLHSGGVPGLFAVEQEHAFVESPLLP